MGVAGDPAAGDPAAGDPAAGVPAAGAPVTIVWSPRKAEFNYTGNTTLYSCDSLESKVRLILSYLGARGDAKVSATGCPMGPDVPARIAWISAEFAVPTPVEPGAGGIPARWSRVELTANRPRFMDGGNCDLIEDMKDFVTKNFVIRDLVYTTSCFPHEVSLDPFTVRGEAPKVIEAKKP
jgi:hypothetical protein